MRIRITGRPGECLAAAAALAECQRLQVLEVSEPYPNRGTSALVRVYIEATVTTPTVGGEPR